MLPALDQLEHLSYSSISSYLYCARAWRLHYLDKVETPNAIALAFGSAFHGTVEQYVAARATLDAQVLQDKGLVGLWNDNWHKETEGIQIAWGADTPEEHCNEGLRILTTPDIKAAIERPQPTCDDQGPQIERKIELRVPGVPVPIIGYIDMVAADGVPCDFKTSSRAWTFDKAQSETQSLFYLAALNQAGINSHRWTFRHIVFTKTKKPEVQVLEHSHKPGEVFWLFAMIADIWRGIEAGIFFQNPTSWKCSPVFCDFWGMCRGKYV